MELTEGEAVFEPNERTATDDETEVMHPDLLAVVEHADCPLRLERNVPPRQLDQHGSVVDRFRKARAERLVNRYGRPDNSLIQCITTHTHVIGANEKLLRVIF